MTPKELSEIMTRLEKYYKTFYQGMDKKEVFAAWFDMFREDDAAEVQKAAIAYICTQTFPPTVAGLKTIMAENRMAGQKTEAEAWQIARSAVDASSSREEAANQYVKLPPLVKRLVGSPGQLVSWRRISEDTFEGVIASNFQRSYRELAKREAVYHAIPGQLQAEQSWRVEGPHEQIALPKPEVKKTISEIVEDANRKAYQAGMVMTPELAEKHSSRVDAFLQPMTEEEKAIVKKREDRRAEQFLK